MSGGDYFSSRRALGASLTGLLPVLLALVPVPAYADGWSTFAGNPQHTAVSSVATQSLDGIRWSTPVDCSRPPEPFSFTTARRS
jgi:hypothetical protein